MAVCDNIRRVRMSKGIKQSHVAEKLGISAMGYCHLEAGDVRLDVERMKKIGDILGVDSAIFLEEALTDKVINGGKSNPGREVRG